MVYDYNTALYPMSMTEAWDGVWPLCVGVPEYCGKLGIRQKVGRCCFYIAAGSDARQERRLLGKAVRLVINMYHVSASGARKTGKFFPSKTRKICPGFSIFGE
jgi:hypothetical protein